MIRPFLFLFRSEIFFRTTRELEYLFYLSRKARNFFQYSTLDYMTKTESKFLFSSTKIRIFFQQHWESEYFFRKKNIAPPPPPPPPPLPLLEVKWAVPYE